MHCWAGLVLRNARRRLVTGIQLRRTPPRPGFREPPPRSDLDHAGPARRGPGLQPDKPTLKKAQPPRGRRTVQEANARRPKPTAHRDSTK